MEGFIATGFEEVGRVFQENFKKRGELGAACCVFHKGRMVIDIWGGYTNSKTKEKWKSSTLALVFSTTKGISALTLAHAHSRGLFDYEDKMAKHWPEFAQNGKEDVTIRQVLSHQAGLCVIDEPISQEKLGDLEYLSSIISLQKPAWQPGVRHGYHTITIGWYENELIRRIDPKHRTLGKYFRDEIAIPLDLDFYIGLPDGISRDRIAPIHSFEPKQVLLGIKQIPWRFVSAFQKRNSLTSRSFRNPRVFSDPLNFNHEEIQKIEIASANGIGSARSIAKLYGEFAAGGKNLGIGERTIQELEKDAGIPEQGMFDAILLVDNIYSCGFSKPHDGFRFGSSNRAYGAPGTGGSFGFADPDEQLGYAYIMNKCGLRFWDDPRELALRQAVYRCVSKMK